MSDTQKNGYDFINEKIKTRPLNKKRILWKVMKLILSGVVFGISACIAFVLLQSVLEHENKTAEEKPHYSIPKDEMEQVTELDTEQETETETETQEEPETEVISTEKDTEATGQELTLYDYQCMQNELYQLGESKKQSLVTVTGVHSNIDWYDSVYETQGESFGLILVANEQEILLLTSAGVVTSAQEIEVTFSEGSRGTGVLKGADANTGIAVVSVATAELQEHILDHIVPVELGNSYQVQPGDFVVAIGNPQGYPSSSLVGCVTSNKNKISAPDGEYSYLSTDIHSDTNSSGALINLKGQVVGWIMKSENSTKLIQAYAISELKDIIERLSNDEAIGFLGIRGSTVTTEIATEYEIPKGVYVKSVEMDSPALSAGIQAGDVIIAIGGQEIHTIEQYQQLVRTLLPGTDVEVKILRQGNEGYTELDYEIHVGT